MDRDVERGVAGLGRIGEELAHLLGRLEVELIVLKPQALRVGDHLPGADAEQHIVRGGVITAQVVEVVGGDGACADLLRQGEQRGAYAVLHRVVVMVDLNEIAVAEDRFVIADQAAGGLELPAGQRLSHRSTEAAGQDDQPRVVLGEQFEIDAGLVVISLEKADRDELEEIAVAGLVGGQHGEMVFVTRAAVGVPARARRTSRSR